MADHTTETAEPIDVDIDELLRGKGYYPKPVDEIDTFRVRLFGESIRVLKSMNVLNIMSLGSDDPAATADAVKSIVNMIHPEDRRKFRNAYAVQPELSGEALGELLKSLFEGATKRNPTSSSSGSGTTLGPAGSTEPSAES